MNLQAPSLQEVQRWMKSRILPGRSSLGHSEIQLNQQNETPGLERLAVYAQGYTARMEEALQEAYPALRQILGPAIFSQLALDYATTQPSHDYNLSFAGRHLPEFLKNWAKTEELPFLPDLSRLEWLIIEAFHSFEKPAVASSDWAKLEGSLGEFIFKFQPSVKRVHSAWPVLDLWQTRNTPRTEIKIDLVDRPQRVLIYRIGETVHCELVSEEQDFLLNELISGKTLADACEALLSKYNQDLPIQNWFSHWAAAGLFVR